MTSDGDLLRRYAQAGAEDAFAELVRRTLTWFSSKGYNDEHGGALACGRRERRPSRAAGIGTKYLNRCRSCGHGH